MKSVNEINQAVILAGGLGTRLGELTKSTPKPMIPVNGKPFLDWQIQSLANQGIESIVVLVSHLGEQIEEYLKSRDFGLLSLSFATEPEPMGTGGALRLSLEKLESTFFLVYGDSYSPTPLAEIEQAYESCGRGSIVLAMTDLDRVPVPGNIKLENNLIVSYKKDGGVENGYTAVDAGICVFNKSDLSLNPDKAKYDLNLYIQDLIAKSRLWAAKTTQPFYDIGTPDRLKYFEEKLHDYF